MNVLNFFSGEDHKGEHQKVDSKEVVKKEVEKDTGTNVTKEITKEDDDDDGEEGMVVIRRSERIRKKYEDLKDFIIEDIVVKRKSRKRREREAKARSLAGPFILDESSVSYRVPTGYYGNFGQSDFTYRDHKEFSPSPPHKFKKNNVIPDDDDDDDDNDLEIGDETLRMNISRNIQFLDEDDIDVDELDKGPPAKPPPSKAPSKVNRGRGRGRPRKKERNVGLNTKGNESNECGGEWRISVDGEFFWSVPGLRQESMCVNYSEIIADMRIGDATDRNLIAILDEFLAGELDNGERQKSDESVQEIEMQQSNEVPDDSTKMDSGVLENETLQPSTNDKSSDESVQIIQIEEEDGKGNSGMQLNTDIVGHVPTGTQSAELPANIPGIDTTGLHYVGYVNVNQPQLVTIDSTKSVLIVNNGNTLDQHIF